MASLDTLLARATSSVPRPTAAQQELLVRLSRLRTRLDEGLLRVAVLGQFKRGKSTLLNALLGVPLLPTGVTPVTAIPTFIKASPDQMMLSRPSGNRTGLRPSHRFHFLTCRRAPWPASCPRASERSGHEISSQQTQRRPFFAILRISTGPYGRNLEDAFRQFESSLTEQLGNVLLATCQAMQFAIERRMTRAEEMDKYVKELARSIASLTNIMSELQASRLELPQEP